MNTKMKFSSKDIIEAIWEVIMETQWKKEGAEVIDKIANSGFQWELDCDNNKIAIYKVHENKDREESDTIYEIVIKKL